MCGIAGIVSDRPVNNLTGLLESMGDIMKHRGPDGEGFLLFDRSKVLPCYGKHPGVLPAGAPYHPHFNLSANNGEGYYGGFVHRRLAIIESGPKGHQPMCDVGSRTWITFNGEIYNYPELRSELLAQGYSFYSGSDTEVVLNAYLAWGPKCVERFSGMWAFAIYDTTKDILFCSRDRLGVKPFYYHLKDGVFSFASEQKVLLKSGIVKAKLNHEALFDFLLLGEMENEAQGLFSSILQLEPGQNLILRLSTMQPEISVYFDRNTFAVDAIPERGEERGPEELRQILLRSVRERMRSDVPVASCLSGGIDSSAIVAAMTRVSPGANIETFTFSAPGKDMDETVFARKVAEHCRVKNSSVEIGPLLKVEDLDELVYSQDLPLWSTSTWAQFGLMKHIHGEGIKVVLDGQGGDELFSGYPHHLYYSYLDQKRQGLGYSGISVLKGDQGSQFFKENLKRWMHKNLPNVFARSFLRSRSGLVELLDPDFVLKYRDRIVSKFSTETGLNEKLLSEQSGKSLRVYLKCEDRCAMWHSIESRTPFSDDPEMIRLSRQLPGNQKVKNDTLKYVLREAARPWLPAEIVGRKDKRGFSTPNREWLKSFSDCHSSVKLDIFEGVFSSNCLNISELFEKVNAENEGDLFKLISLSAWGRVFF